MDVTLIERLRGEVHWRQTVAGIDCLQGVGLADPLFEISGVISVYFLFDMRGKTGYNYYMILCDILVATKLQVEGPWQKADIPESLFKTGGRVNPPPGPEHHNIM